MLLNEKSLTDDRKNYVMDSGMETFLKSLIDVFGLGYLDVMSVHAIGCMFNIAINLKVPGIEGKLFALFMGGVFVEGCHLISFANLAFVNQNAYI